jgi:hypothetical protein
MTSPSDRVASSVIRGDERASGLTHTRSAATPMSPVMTMEAAKASGSITAAVPTPAAASPARTESPAKAPSM